MCFRAEASQLLMKAFSDLRSLPRSFSEYVFMMGFFFLFPVLLSYACPFRPEHLGCKLTQKGVIVEKTYSAQLKIIEDNALNGIWKLSSLPLLKTLPLFQKSEQSSYRENEVHWCILREAFKVEYSSNKKECELQLAWLWLNVYDLGVQNSKILRKWTNLL